MYNNAQIAATRFCYTVPIIRLYIIIIIIIINCNWVITQWQWLYYMSTNMERKKT